MCNLKLTLYAQISTYPCVFRIFSDPILYLACLKTSWEYSPKRHVIYHRGQDFRSFMIQGVDSEFNFLLEGGFEDNQGSFSTKSLNNETPILDAEPIFVALHVNVADNIIDSSNTSYDDELPPMYPPTSSFPKVGKKSKAASKRKLVVDVLREGSHRRARRAPVQVSKVAGDASTPLYVDSDPGIHEFLFARELKMPLIVTRSYMRQAVLDNMLNNRTRELISALHKARASCDAIWESSSRGIRPMLSLKRSQVNVLHNEYGMLLIEEVKWANYEQTLSLLCAKFEGLESERERPKPSEIQILEEIDRLRQDRAAVVSRVVPGAAMKLVHSDEMCVLVARLVRAAVVHGRWGCDSPYFSPMKVLIRTFKKFNVSSGDIELWSICGKVGTLADVYIANRKNKLGQMYAFCRCIRVSNYDTLIASLSNILIGKLHLHANVVRFDRKAVRKTSHTGVKLVYPVDNGDRFQSSNKGTFYANVAKASINVGRNFRSIANAHTLCSCEGFREVVIKYLGGLWVLFEFSKVETKSKFLKHKCILTWFSSLKPWYDDFVVEERLVWLEIEGVPLRAWNNDTFTSIGRKAVWDCHGDRATGPDGFTFKFFTTFWDLLEEDVNRFVQDFFVSSSFPKGCNSSFIALIPKVSNVTLVTDFRPISLIGCQYKIIGKILDNRLSMVIGSYLSPEQSTFIKGRNILDGPIILSEAMAWYRKCKKQLMIFKVDFEKAFDFLAVGFLRPSHGKARVWSIVAVLDQRVPYYRHRYLLMCRIGDNNMSLSHLIYDDDVIFLGVCVSNENISNMAAILGCGVVALLLKYLGVHVGCNMTRCSNWDAIFQKFSSKLTLWNARLLSTGGRLSLINSVLGSLPTYYMSLYKVPVFVCNKLESMRNNFFIGGDLGEKMITWKGIDLLSLYIRKLRDGTSIRFWDDIWCGHHPLKVQFPRIFMFDNDKSCCIASRLTLANWSNVLRRQPRGGIQSHQLSELQLLIGTSSYQSITIHGNGLFMFPKDSMSRRRQLSLNKLPSRMNLDRKGIEVDSLLCPICHEDVETANHTFFNCEMAQDLWALLARWWELDIPLCENILEWFTWLDSSSLSTKARLILDGVGRTLLWSIWSIRNRLVLSNSPPKKMVLWDIAIVFMDFFWKS
uniref:RNA-directed DNA polymerase, eukaryota n=1 Tax=Tanacetum cinerariifolium TaxID=118510 RepID=A0A6L2KIF2_TANCI|nr:RNA-directed DNA polymerase, eukaryota [Tanacetum cinerariifolium]